MHRYSSKWPFSNAQPEAHRPSLSSAVALPLLVAAALCLAAGPGRAVQFGGLTDLQTGIGFTAVLTFGPEDPDPLSLADGCIYAVHASNAR